MSRSVVILAVAAASLAACSQRDAVVPREAGAKLCGRRPVSLAVGQVAVPSSPGAKGCDVAGIVGAEYIVAWVDPRAINAAREGTEPFFESYPMRLSINPGADPWLREAEPSREPAGGHERDLVVRSASSGVLEAMPRQRRVPWTLGEEFLLAFDEAESPERAEVLRVYEGGWVVARLSDDTTDDLDVFLRQLDSAFAMHRGVAEPLLRHAFVDSVPRSSQAAQTLIVLQRRIPAPARAFAELSGDTVYTWFDLYAYPWLSATRLAQTLVHEIAHGYQLLHMHRSRPSPGLPVVPGASYWAVEGGANLISYELVRRMAGIPLDANHEWRAPATSVAMAFYQQRAQPANGLLTDGFDHAMGFLRDLTLRRMAAGEPVDDALRAVSRGAIEGWFGLDGITRRTGLTERMRAILGVRWEPAEALLDWALSHGADDVTPNPRYQDRASYRIWELPPGQNYGWRSDAILSPTAPTHFFFKRFGSPGWARLSDDGGGFELEVQGYEVPLQWKLLRIR